MQLTNFPNVGENKEILLKNSKYPLPHKNLGLAIKAMYPELWDRVAFKDNQVFKDLNRIRDGEHVEGANAIIAAREVILSKYAKNPSPDAIFKLLKWHGLSELGQAHMEEAVQKMAEYEKAKNPPSQVVKLTLKSLFSNEAKGVIRGFCSVAKVDRGGDYVDPTEFDLTYFKKNPQLLYNHKLWKDGLGNEIPVGNISLISPAYVIDQSPPSQSYEIRSYGNELLAIIAKQDFPGLVPYDVGLWVEANVTVEEIWQKIEAKELNGFSWQGLANRVVSERGRNTLLNVDLIEVSVVHLPANKYASFEVSPPIRQVSISKDLFNSIADAQDSLNFLSNNDILEVDGQWVISKDSILPTYDEAISKKITLKYLEQSVENQEKATSEVTAAVEPVTEVKPEEVVVEPVKTEDTKTEEVAPETPKDGVSVEKAVVPTVSQDYSVLTTSFREVTESTTKVVSIVSKMAETLKSVQEELSLLKKSLKPEAANQVTTEDVIKKEVEKQGKELATQLENVLKSAFVGTETERSDSSKETVKKNASVNDIFSGLVPFGKR